MHNSVLDQLNADDLHANACTFSTGRSLHHFLASRPEIAAVRAALRQGTITEAAIKSFVDTLLADLRAGVLFPHDRTLAALAVVLEQWFTPFADDFLKSLANLRLAEMPLASRVAQEAIQERPSCATQRETVALGDVSKDQASRG